METTAEALRTVNLGAVCLLAAASLWRWRRAGGEAARWVAFAFLGLASVLVLRRLLPEPPPNALLVWLEKLATALAVAFPYFFYRFTTSFRPTNRRVGQFVTGAAALLVAWTLLLPGFPATSGARPTWASAYLAAVVVHWVALSVFVGARLWREGSAQPAIARRRMRTLSLGSLALSLAILAGVGPRDRSPLIDVAFRGSFLLSSGLFFLAFWPPRSLRAAWRRSAEDEVWKGLGRLVAATRREDVAAEVVNHAVQLVGARGAVLLDAEGVAIASTGSVGEVPVTAGNAAPDASKAPPPLRLTFGTGCLVVWAGPYTPFFGTEEVALVRSLAALADLALGRVRSGEKEAQLAAIVASSDDAIIGTDVEGSIVSWNAGAERLFGYRGDEVIGRSMSLLAPEHGRGEVTQILERIRGGEVVDDYETVRLAKDGRTIEVSLTVSPIRNAQGEITGPSTIARDISRRKRMEEELAAVHLQALEASRHKSEFLATMSHEIRTPMNGVIGMTGLLLSTELSDEQREYAEAVRLSADALLGIINDILDFSKVEAGKLELEILDFDLRTVVEEVADLLAERAHDKGLELATLVAPGVPLTLQGDPGRIRQVLVNLVANAVKFTEQGEVVVRVELVEEAEAEVVVRCSVTDTGIGISADAQARLFQSFSQVDASTTRTYGGTGLGLAICRRLAELMGGEVGVQSEPGLGSEFWFTLRLGKGQRPAAQANRGRLRGLRVLVVDDNETNRIIVEHNLAAIGMRPDTAESGLCALEMLRSAVIGGDPYAVAVLDYHMPGMDGIELARGIKGHTDLVGTRLVLLTSSVGRGDARLAHAAGIDGFLTKPIRVLALYDTLATVMGLEPERDPRPALVTQYTVAEANAGSRPHILVVEDNAVNQKVAARMMERLGYRVDLAANGLEALHALSRIHYAAVLMDCQMPEMDGYEATRQIRTLKEPARSTPIIAMTAGAMTVDEEKARGAGMDDYVSKPVSPERLAEVLKRWVEVAPTE